MLDHSSNTKGYRFADLEAKARDGVPALMWTAHSTIFGIAVNTTLLADAQSMVPLAVFMAGAPNSLIGANSRRIFNFQAREEPFPAATFTSVCGL